MIPCFGKLNFAQEEQKRRAISESTNIVAHLKQGKSRSLQASVLRIDEVVGDHPHQETLFFRWSALAQVDRGLPLQWTLVLQLSSPQMAKGICTLTLVGFQLQMPVSRLKEAHEEKLRSHTVFEIDVFENRGNLWQIAESASPISGMR